jgi:hypothetical protein
VQIDGEDGRTLETVDVSEVSRRNDFVDGAGQQCQVPISGRGGEHQVSVGKVPPQPTERGHAGQQVPEPQRSQYVDDLAGHG